MQVTLTRDELARERRDDHAAAADDGAGRGARYIGLDGAAERYDLELDVEYETWSRANQFVLDTHGLEATAMGQVVPIGRIVVPKQWKNVVSLKLGGDLALVPERWTLRAGVYYESAVASPAYANVDFPGGPQLGGALGGSFLFDRWEVALTYQLRYQPSVTVSGGQRARLPAGPGQPVRGALHRPEHLQRALSGTAGAGGQRGNLHGQLALAGAGVRVPLRRRGDAPTGAAMKHARRSFALALVMLVTVVGPRGARR